MGPYKPLRTWVDEFIPYYMEIRIGSLDPIAHMIHLRKTSMNPETNAQRKMISMAFPTG